MNKTDKYIRIVRYANEGFQLRKFMLSENIYHGAVNSIVPIEIQIDNDPLLAQKNPTVEACYCHFYLFNNNAYSKDGVMGIRHGHAINIAYLPADQFVYVRAANALDQPLLKYYRMAENPFDYSMYRFDEQSTTDRFHWAKMTLSDAVQRNKEFLKHKDDIPEKFSEMLLTSDSKRALMDITRKNFGYSFHKKHPPTKENTKKSLFSRTLFKKF